MTPQLTTICVTRREQEQQLSLVITSRPNPQQLALPKCTQIAPQVVEITHSSHAELTTLPLFFATQSLPNPQKISASSINTWANAVFSALVDFFGDSPNPWALHIFEPDAAETGQQYARQSRIEAEILRALKQKRRSYLKAMTNTITPDTTIVQVLTISPDYGYISFCTPEMRALYRSAISPHLGGYLSIPDDKGPPSRAFKKLTEAIALWDLNMASHHTAVDLGAAPGGWTYVLRQHGVKVTAIDRSPLAPPLSRDRKISFITGNALTWEPAEPVDWMVCDVITPPANTFKILKTWLSKKYCQNFCVTIKFQGDPAIKTLLEIADFLKISTTWCDGKQLTHNKNELTVVGQVELPSI